MDFSVFICRFAVTTCSIMPARSVTGWPCNLAVWRSGETALFACLCNLMVGVWNYRHFFCRRFYKDMNAKGLEKKSNFELLE